MAAQSIVVATGGSRESVLSVEWAAVEADRRGVPLRIVSTPAMPPRMRPAYGAQATVADALRDASVQALTTAAGRAAEVAPNVRVDTDLLSGAPAQAITDAASSASMLVVGARGAGGFAAMILGSVSRYAAMHAACSTTRTVPSRSSPRRIEVVAQPPWQAVPMADDKPEPGAKKRVTAELDELMATVLRHLRTGQGAPLEELGLDKAADELQHWRPDIPGSGAQG